MKSQTSTEYLIILAIVIVIAIIVIGILGGIPSIGGGASKKAKLAELRSGKISVENFFVNSTYAKLEMRNNQPMTISILNISIDEENCESSSLPLSLSIGKAKTIECIGDFTDHSGGKTVPDIGFYYRDMQTRALYETEKYFKKIPSVVSFIDPTPLSGATITNNYFYVNVNASINTNHSVILNFNNSFIHWWRMDEMNSNTVFDYVGNSDGVIVGDVTQNESGKMGKALDIDGGENYISLNINELNDESFSFSFWINPKNQQLYSTDARLISLGNTVVIRFTTNDNEVEFLMTPFDSDDTITTPITPEIWTHIATIFDGEKMLLYKNSIEAVNSTPTGSFSLGGTNWKIGSDYNTFNGSIDDVMVFNRALDVDEIKSIYNANITKYQKNFINLADDTYTIKAYAQHYNGSIYSTNTRSITVNAN